VDNVQKEGGIKFVEKN